MRAGLYARVSTTDQDPDLQLVALREYAERRGFSVVGEYVDLGVSGAKERRPELDRLMLDAGQRRLDVVLVWKFDRFARSTRHLVNALEEFRDLGVQFVSLTEAIDTSTAIGRVLFTIVGAMAEFERDLIRERVRAGVARARAKGKRLGRPRVQVDRERLITLRGHPHALRRAVASHLVQAGVDVKAVQVLLGHANVASTSLYLGLDMRDLRRAVETLEPDR